MRLNCSEIKSQGIPGFTINFRFSHYSRSNTGIIKIPAKVISQKLTAPKMVDAEFLYDNAESNELISYVISDDNLIIQEYMNILNERQKDIIHKIFILARAGETRSVFFFSYT